LPPQINVWFEVNSSSYNQSRTCSVFVFNLGKYQHWLDQKILLQVYAKLSDVEDIQLDDNKLFDVKSDMTQAMENDNNLMLT